MSEVLNTWYVGQPYKKAEPMNRTRFYEEQCAVARANGSPTRMAEVVHLFLFNQMGQILLQLRADDKGHNPGLLDKPVAGHILSGSPPRRSVTAEAMQEIGVPCYMVGERESLKDAVSELRVHLNRQAVVMRIITTDATLHKVFRTADGGRETLPLAYRVHLYFGLYYGDFQFLDGEAKDIKAYALADLCREIEERPALFTNDVGYWLKAKGDQFEQFAREAR